MLAPMDETELAETIAAAAGPLNIKGGGTRPIGSPQGGQSLTTSELSGISLYEPGALTIVARSGTPMSEITAALAAENQMLPFEPMDHRSLLGTSGTPTIGGVVAANVSGPRRPQVGACRDSLIGVRYVDGTGTVIKNGGRVMKNVTGYDLVKLMAGSYGTLGVLSEVSFKVLPKPDTETTLSIQGQSVDAAVAAMSAALGSPFEVSGAAHGPISTDGAPTYLRIEGFETSVEYRAEELRKLLSGFGEIAISDAEGSRTLWKEIRDVREFAAHGCVTRVSIKGTDLPELYSAAKNAFSSEGSGSSPFDVLLDWGGGLAWFAGHDPALAIEGVTLHRWLQQYCKGHGGHATLFKGVAQTPVFQPEPELLANLANGLRKKFDPKGILNPGLMGV